MVGGTLMRQTLWTAADTARRADPQLAATFVRLMNAVRHHDTAICPVATTLRTRISTYRQADKPYVISDVDGSRSPKPRIDASLKNTTGRPARGFPDRGYAAWSLGRSADASSSTFGTSSHGMFNEEVSAREG